MIEPGLFRTLFPPEVRVAEMDPRLASVDALFPSERACVARAVELRRRQFAAGRQLARQLLQDLGFREVAIPMGADGAPEWPEGVTGTITHCDELAAAAVVRLDTIAGIGADVESCADLPEPMREIVLTRAERARFAAVGPLEDLVRIVFSAKESAYKAQYAITHAFLEHGDLEIELVPEGGFLARLTRAVEPLPAGFVIEGRVRVDRGLIRSAAMLRA